MLLLIVLVISRVVGVVELVLTTRRHLKHHPHLLLLLEYNS